MPRITGSSAKASHSMFSRSSAPPLIHDAIGLVPLATDPGIQMNFFGHDGHPLGMDATQVGVLEETHEIHLCLAWIAPTRYAAEAPTAR
jgi:hypothetical protein